MFKGSDHPPPEYALMFPDPSVPFSRPMYIPSSPVYYVTPIDENNPSPPPLPSNTCRLLAPPVLPVPSSTHASPSDPPVSVLGKITYHEKPKNLYVNLTPPSMYGNHPPPSLDVYDKCCPRLFTYQNGPAFFSNFNPRIGTKAVVGYQVPLTTDEQLSSWQAFKEGDEGNPIATCIMYTRDGNKSVKFIEVEHPFVTVLTKFALDNFNELCVKARVSKGLQLIRVVNACYLSRRKVYVYRLILEVKLNREHGGPGGILIYYILIETDRVVGTMTLVRCRHLSFGLIGDKESPGDKESEAASCSYPLKMKLETQDLGSSSTVPFPKLPQKFSLYPVADGIYNYLNPAYNEFHDCI